MWWDNDTARVAWDWASKMGLGGLLVWFVQRWLSKRDKQAERGQQLVDAARPELVATTNLGGQYTVQLNVENRGKGPARTLRMGFTGVAEIEARDEVPGGQTRLTASLNIQGSAFFTEAHEGRAEITVIYADRFDNEYRLILPVTRQKRADGGFNMVIRWLDYKNAGPRLSKKRLREIGGS